MNRTGNCALGLAAFVAAALVVGAASAQTVPSETKPAEGRAPDTGALAPLAWLEGCWHGTVGPREFQEHWMPLRGNLLVGVSQTFAQGKTLSYEYLRIESRPDGVYYVATPSGQKETAFRFAEQTVDRSGGRDDELFTFVDPTHDFPQKITYRRASEGWLYATLDGKVGGADRQVTYPMRRVGCESGEYIRR